MKKDVHEMLEEYDFSQAEQGQIVSSNPNTTQIMIRIETEILDWLREQVNTAGGGSYQLLINQVLREHIQNQPQSLETTLRRVIREELQLVNVNHTTYEPKAA
jgi:uncharacterized protein (DUF4415 family)